MMLTLLQNEVGWPLTAYCCLSIVNKPLPLYDANVGVRPVSQKPSYIDVTQQEWDEFGKRVHERIIQGLMQDKSLTREQAEKLYDELPI